MKLMFQDFLCILYFRFIVILLVIDNGRNLVVEVVDRKKKYMGYFMVFVFLRCYLVYNNRLELLFVILKVSNKVYYL